MLEQSNSCDSLTSDDAPNCNDSGTVQRSNSSCEDSQTCCDIRDESTPYHNVSQEPYLPFGATHESGTYGSDNYLCDSSPHQHSNDGNDRGNDPVEAGFEPYPRTQAELQDPRLTLTLTVTLDPI